MSSEACARRPARPALPPLTQRRAPRPGDTAGLPRRPRAARGSGFVSAPVPGLQPRPPEGQEPGGSSPVRLQPSRARRAAAPALGIPAAAPAAAAAAAPLSGMPGGRRCALLLIHEGAAKAGDWAEVRWARPGSAGTDPRCGRPTPPRRPLPRLWPCARDGAAGAGPAGSCTPDTPGDPLP